MSEPTSQPKTSFNWDIVAGALVVAIGAAFLFFGSKLRMGTLSEMGPGYVPIAASIILIGLGAAILLQALFKASQRVDWPALRPFVVVVLCPALFALLIGRIGLVLTIIIVASIARLAEPQRFGLEAVLMPPLLAAFCVLVFTYLLSLPIPLWP